MSPGQTGHITGQMGRVPGTDGTHTRGCPAKILYVYWFFLSLIHLFCLTLNFVLLGELKLEPVFLLAWELLDYIGEI